MGTVITLGLGNLEIDWGKNFTFTNHHSLFKKSDLKKWKCKDFDEYAEEEDKIIYKERKALVSKLSNILPRLELLGYTNKSAKYIYYLPVLEGHTTKRDLIPYEKLEQALKEIKLDKLPLDYKNWDYDYGEFTRKNIIEKLNIKFNKTRFLEISLENFDPLAILRILANNKENLDIPLVWDFQELIENGYAKKEDILAPLKQDNKFIIITEGTTDTNILKNAINILRPEISDFFTFIDMEHGYPFSGTGSLNNFCSGLVKIGALNNIVIIYDNDTTGLYTYQITQKLNLPNNIKVMKLPELDSLNNFSTIGPSGVNQENINGKAASIECFLDLEWEKNLEPLVRWTSFNNNIEQYQGELVNKDLYTKKFLHLKGINIKYNYDKLNILIDNIFNECVCISEAKIMN